MMDASDDFDGDEVGFGFASQSLLAFGNLRVLHLRWGLIRFVDCKGSVKLRSKSGPSC